jgi:hypothetical protein
MLPKSDGNLGTYLHPILHHDLTTHYVTVQLGKLQSKNYSEAVYLSEIHGTIPYTCDVNGHFYDLASCRLISRLPNEMLRNCAAVFAASRLL